MEGFANAMGLEFHRLAGDPVPKLRRALNSPEPTLVELLLEDSPEMGLVKKKAAAKAAVRSLVGDGNVDRMKRLLGRKAPGDQGPV
jgi:hypothetical protein